MTASTDYQLVLTPPARTIASKLPQPIATAVIDFMTTALVANPRRVGKRPATTWPGSGPHDAAPTESSVA